MASAEEPQRCEISKQHFHGTLWYLCIKVTWKKPISFPGRILKSFGIVVGWGFFVVVVLFVYLFVFVFGFFWVLFVLVLGRDSRCCSIFI